MKRGIRFSSPAWEHYQYWMVQDKAMLRRINALVTECLRDPYNGIGKPEPLKHEFSGWWSRRIDQEHRLVYRWREETLEIAALRYHCGE
jgi:toxin YoeB